MDSRPGIEALNILINNIDKVDIFAIYTGFKNAPVTWDPSYLKSEEFMRFYPNFPNKPQISHPIQPEEYGQFCRALEEHLGMSYSSDILTFRKEYGVWKMLAEATDEEKQFGQSDLITFLRNLMGCWRINIIEINGDVVFDLRTEAATDKKDPKVQERMDLLRKIAKILDL